MFQCMLFNACLSFIELGTKNLKLYRLYHKYKAYYGIHVSHYQLLFDVKPY